MVWVQPTGVFPAVLAVIGVAAGLHTWVQLTGNVASTMTPEFQAELRKRGSIPVMERSGAPAVYLNPITNGLPGYIRGPDDLAAE